MVEPHPLFAKERFVCDRSMLDKGTYHLKIVKNLKVDPYSVETLDTSFDLNLSLFASRVFFVGVSLVANIDDLRDKIGLKSVDPESTAQLLVT